MLRRVFRHQKRHHDVIRTNSDAVRAIMPCSTVLVSVYKIFGAFSFYFIFKQLFHTRFLDIRGSLPTSQLGATIRPTNPSCLEAHFISKP